MDTFVQAQEFLKKLPDDICEKHLFKIISELQVEAFYLYFL